MITVECIIPQKHHRTVMGAKGRKVQSITSEYDVQIKFPDRDVYGKYQFFLHVKECKIANYVNFLNKYMKMSMFDVF